MEATNNPSLRLGPAYRKGLMAPHFLTALLSFARILFWTCSPVLRGALGEEEHWARASLVSNAHQA